MELSVDLASPYSLEIESKSMLEKSGAETALLKLKIIQIKRIVQMKIIQMICPFNIFKYVKNMSDIFMSKGV